MLLKLIHTTRGKPACKVRTVLLVSMSRTSRGAQRPTMPARNLRSWPALRMTGVRMTIRNTAAKGLAPRWVGGGKEMGST